MTRMAHGVFVALVLAALAQVAWQHGHLPERVATHFGAAGQADGWLTRGRHTAWHAATVVFMAALFLGTAELPRRLPNQLVNLPHREYWLAPERAAATAAALATAILSIGCAVMAFFLLLFHLTYRANLTAQPRLDAGVWLAAAALLVVVTGMLARLYWRFARRPAA